MNRRSFLALTPAALAGFALDPERALWVPGRRTYFDIVRPIPDVPPHLALEYDDGTIVYFDADRGHTRYLGGIKIAEWRIEIA